MTIKNKCIDSLIILQKLTFNWMSAFFILPIVISERRISVEE
jgi:hypothetical protein